MKFVGEFINPMFESRVLAAGQHHHEFIFGGDIIRKRLVMRENGGPGNVGGVKDGSDVEADRVKIFIIENRGNDFVCKFFEDGGCSEGVEMGLLKVRDGEGPYAANQAAGGK